MDEKRAKLRLEGGFQHSASADAARVAFENGAIRHAAGIEDLKTLFISQEEPGEPFSAVAFFHGGELAAALVSEPYAFVGGRAPYHDTYTQNLYARSPVTARFMEEIRANFGQRIGGCFEGSNLPTHGRTDALHALWRRAAGSRWQRQRERLVSRALSGPHSGRQ